MIGRCHTFLPFYVLFGTMALLLCSFLILKNLEELPLSFIFVFCGFLLKNAFEDLGGVLQILVLIFHKAQVLKFTFVIPLTIFKQPNFFCLIFILVVDKFHSFLNSVDFGLHVFQFCVYVSNMLFQFTESLFNKALFIYILLFISKFMIVHL